MASNEPLDDTRDWSSVEVEQLLSCTEHGPDPRDFYASDSPVPDEPFDSVQGSECVRFKMVIKSRALLRVTYGFLIYLHISG